MKNDRERFERMRTTLACAATEGRNMLKAQQDAAVALLHLENVAAGLAEDSDKRAEAMLSQALATLAVHAGLVERHADNLMRDVLLRRLARQADEIEQGRQA